MIFGIKQLRFQERKWLHIVLWKLVTSSGWVTKLEQSSFHDAMQYVRKSEMELIIDEFEKMGGEFPYLPERGINADKAGVILFEIMRVAAINGELTLGEMNIIEAAARALGFDEEFIEKVLKITAEKAHANRAQMNLLKNLKDHFTQRNTVQA
ncbi:MAG: hypothetical protein QNL04_05710 [SAR324 cluster bacterium]|nr:hypothetical protein [SAR324 cluster bacterium]